MEERKRVVNVSPMGTQADSSVPQLLLLILLACVHSEMAKESAQLCAHTSPSSSPPSSVHSLRPGDVMMLSVLGLATSHRSDQIRVLNELAEILTTFNSNVTTLLTRQTRLQTEVERLALSLKSNQWKLVLLFVPVDDLCVCSGQASEAIVDSVVQRVEEALDVLHMKLNRTLVHVVVCGGQAGAGLYSHDGGCECQKREHFSVRTQIRRRLMAVVQESLDALLQRRFWWSDREDFSSVLQTTPTYINSEAGGSPSSLLSRDTLHLWRKLLQPMRSETEVEMGAFPCPSVERPYLYTQRNSRSQTESQEAPSAPSQPENMGTSLPCTDKTPSPSVPTSVHALRPADIKVLAVLGDSLMTGNGIGATQNNTLGVLRDSRGLSQSVGDDLDASSVTTLANILRQFNPSLTCYSMAEGEAAPTQTFLRKNPAGAKNKDLISQTRALIRRMKGDSHINFQNDWKVITVFVGENELCDHCSNTDYSSAESFASYIREALDVLHDEVPRAIVNLVEMFHIGSLRQKQHSRLGCPTWNTKSTCSCVMNPAKGPPDSQALTDIIEAYQDSAQGLVRSGRFDTRSDFTVTLLTLRPFVRNGTITVPLDGRPDHSVFAADCFRLSGRSQALVTRALWNNMLEPVGAKTTSLNFMEPVSIKCPSKSAPFLATYGNSKSVYKAAPVTPPPNPITTPSNPPSHLNWGSNFSCTLTKPSDSPPTSVHRLRPGDINVVASLGDSITAGFGAKAQNIVQLPNEERGVSWSIGGDENLETVTTIPNILKKFNLKVFGFSRGRSKRPNGFNMAVSGAKASGIPGQVKDLIEAMRNSTNVDFEQDWKLVTLFIGGNDLCQYCQDRDSLSPKKYIEHIKDALDILYYEVPRMLVNIVEILQIENLRMIKSNTFGCTILQPTLCPCFLRPEDNSEDLVEMKRINREMQTETERLVYGGRYNRRDDFAVVLQPFFQNTVVPMGTDRKPDLTFFSVDCFHFTEHGHAEMAIALWNNMLEPVGRKQIYNNFTHDRTKIRCPTEEHPFIFTLANTPGTPLTPNGCQESVASWVPPVLAVAGVIVGAVITWLLLHCKDQRKRRNLKMSSVEMKVTGF